MDFNETIKKLDIILEACKDRDVIVFDPNKETLIDGRPNGYER